MEEARSAEAGGWSQQFVVAITVATLTVLCFALFSRFEKKNRRLPPGPKGLPVFGSLFAVGTLPHRSFAKLAKQYGPIMFFHMGSVKTLVVTSPEMAKEILKTHDQIWSTRPKQIMSSYLSYGKDIAFANYGSHWRNVRKVGTLELFTTARLTQFQSVRQGEVVATLQHILDASREGSSVNMQETLANLTTNTMTQMMWNKRY